MIVSLTSALMALVLMESIAICVFVILDILEWIATKISMIVNLTHA